MSTATAGFSSDISHSSVSAGASCARGTTSPPETPPTRSGLTIGDHRLCGSRDQGLLIGMMISVRHSSAPTSPGSFRYRSIGGPAISYPLSSIHAQSAW